MANIYFPEEVKLNISDKLPISDLLNLASTSKDQARFVIRNYKQNILKYGTISQLNQFAKLENILYPPDKWHLETSQRMNKLVHEQPSEWLNITYPPEYKDHGDNYVGYAIDNFEVRRNRRYLFSHLPLDKTELENIVFVINKNNIELEDDEIWTLLTYCLILNSPRSNQYVDIENVLVKKDYMKQELAELDQRQNPIPTPIISTTTPISSSKPNIAQERGRIKKSQAFIDYCVLRRLSLDPTFITTLKYNGPFHFSKTVRLLIIFLYGGNYKEIEYLLQGPFSKKEQTLALELNPRHDIFRIVQTIKFLQSGVRSYKPTNQLLSNPFDNDTRLYALSLAKNAEEKKIIFMTLEKPYSVPGINFEE